jgi:hypothetical protein
MGENLIQGWRVDVDLRQGPQDKIPMNSNKYIGNCVFCDTVRQLVTNFLSGLEDRMISCPKRFRIRSKGIAFHL